MTTRIIPTEAGRDAALKPHLLAHYLSSKQKGASGWLTTLPTGTLTRLGNDEVATGLCLRWSVASPLVVPVELRGRGCACVEAGQQRASTAARVTLLHLTSCRIHAVHIKRHDTVGEHLAFLLRNASVPVRVEERMDDRVGGDLSFTINNRPVNVDVTVRTLITTAPSDNSKAMSIPLFRAKEAEKEKYQLYEQRYRDLGVEFHPFAMEAQSTALGDGANALIDSLQSHINNNHLVVPFPTTFQTPHYAAYVRQVISVAGIRANAKMIRESLKYTARAAGIRGARLKACHTNRRRKLNSRPRLFIFIYHTGVLSVISSKTDGQTNNGVSRESWSPINSHKHVRS